MSIDLLDLLILIALAVGLLNGHQRGFWLSVVQYAALLIGVLLGATIAPAVVARLGINRAYWPLAAILVLVVTASVISSLGHWLAEPLKRRARPLPARGTWTGFANPDRMSGAAFSGLAVLSVVWFLGLTFARGPNTEVSQQIQGSAIEHRLDDLSPRPPGFLASVEGVLANTPFPPAFAGLEPNSLPGPLDIQPGSGATTGVQTAADSTLKITGHGCDGIVTGSGFPVLRTGLVMTNAHVVAGTTGTTITLPTTQKTLRADVVLIDTDRDVAILRAPGLKLSPLPTAVGDRGTQGAIIGYPNGGPRKVSDAIVDGTFQAHSRDIYNQNPVTREIFIVEGTVEPGNSGGPLVDREGHLLGVVFAASTTHPNQAYALTDREVSSALDRVDSASGAIDTSQFRCAI